MDDREFFESDIKHQNDLIKTHINALRLLELQAARHGSPAPLNLLTQLEDIKQQIDMCRTRIERNKQNLLVIRENDTDMISIEKEILKNINSRLYEYEKSNLLNIDSEMENIRFEREKELDKAIMMRKQQLLNDLEIRIKIIEERLLEELSARLKVYEKQEMNAVKQLVSANIIPGLILDGTISRLTELGAIVDLGVNYDGLIPMRELWNAGIGEISEDGDVVSIIHVGDRVRVCVGAVDLSSGYINVSLDDDSTDTLHGDSTDAFDIESHLLPEREVATFGDEEVEEDLGGNATLDDLLSKFGSEDSRRPNRKRYEKDEEVEEDDETREMRARRDAIRRTLRDTFDDSATEGDIKSRW